MENATTWIGKTSRTIALILALTFLYVLNIAGQDYISYNKSISEARKQAYVLHDTAQAIEYYERAFELGVQSFGLHIEEYFELLNYSNEIKSPGLEMVSSQLTFARVEDRELFFRIHDFSSYSHNAKLLKDTTYRAVINQLYLEDQSIDRKSPYREELFKNLLDKFQYTIETKGFPTEEKIGVYVDENGRLTESKINILLIHAMQARHEFFLDSRGQFQQDGFITASFSSFLEKMTPSDRVVITRF